MQPKMVSNLYYEPFLLSRYDCDDACVAIGRHEHKKNEPCHLTIVASGEVEITVYDGDKNPIRRERYTAPSVIDYNDGADRHHSIDVVVPGTTFFNIPRVLTDYKQFVSEELTWAP